MTDEGVALDPGTYGRYLAGGEVTALAVRRHVTVLARDALAAVAAVVAATVAGLVVSPGDGADVIDNVAGLAAAFFVVRLAWRTWEWRADRIVVTNRRIVEVSGVLTRKVASMPLAKVTDMTYRRSLLGRLLGYGELVVESAGQHQGLSRIGHLPHPDHFYRTVTSLVASAPVVVEREDAGSPEDDDTGPLPRVVV